VLPAGQADVDDWHNTPVLQLTLTDCGDPQADAFGQRKKRSIPLAMPVVLHPFIARKVLAAPSQSAHGESAQLTHSPDDSLARNTVRFSMESSNPAAKHTGITASLL